MIPCCPINHLYIFDYMQTPKPDLAFWLLLSVSLFAACQSNPGEKPADGAANHPPMFSENYRQPVFADKDRAQKVKDAADAFAAIFAAQAESRHIPGLVYGVVVDDELVVAGGIGRLKLDGAAPTPQSAFRIASMTKSFTAMAIVKLRDAGKLSLEDPVSRFVPEMTKLSYLTEDAPIIDIENLLTMTAGFPEDNPWGDRQLAVPDAGLIDLVAGGLSFSNVSSFQNEYSNLSYALLGHIVSVVSGRPFQQYIREEILLPLGMEHTYWEYDEVPAELMAIGYRYEDDQWKEEPMLHDGVFGAMGGLITTIEDFSKYVRFLLSAWPPRNGADDGPIRRSSLREMQTPQFTGLNAKSTNYKGDPCPLINGYGFGLGISRDCDNIVRVGHGGALPGFGSSYRFFPDYGIGVMAFGNLTYTSPFPSRELEMLLLETIGLKARELPVSAILEQRKQQVFQLIQTWDTTLETAILAENFYLDRSRERRMQQIGAVLEQAGTLAGPLEMQPLNQLRGSFKIPGEKGMINVYFTLTPEQDPKVQQLDVSFEPAAS